MKCKILHDTAGRLRVHLCCKRMTLRQADVLEYYLLAVDGVRSVKVYDRTRDAVVVYDAERERMIRALARFSFEKAEKLDLAPEHTSRTLNREFEDKLALTVMRRCASSIGDTAADVNTAPAKMGRGCVFWRKCGILASEFTMREGGSWRMRGRPSPSAGSL